MRQIFENHIHVGGGRTILRYTVFDYFLGGETVIYVNFARYSMIKLHDGDKSP